MILRDEGLYSFLTDVRNGGFGVREDCFEFWCPVELVALAVWLPDGCLFGGMVLVWVTVVRFFVYTPSINRVDY